MDLVTPAQLADKQKSATDDDLARYQELADQLKVLVQLPGYKYAKRMSMSYVIQPYACHPPTNEQERIRWETYNTVRWGFERLWHMIESIAAGTFELPKEQQVNADSRGKPGAISLI
ncbi:MAG TPA: hypothetical protein V6D22_16890 [Candidatus Obscuribacterales bacterium]